MADKASLGSGPPDAEEEFFVVGIGASAGGISPLREFFSRVSADSGMAFVVILHLSPQHESNLPAVLQSQTPLRVAEVTEKVKVEPNHVYVIPPTKYLVIRDGMIHLTEPERTRGAHTSIDLFFRTLADAYGKNSIAILLSGTGADGVLGLRRIKEEGGFAIVQDPAEAEYADMPRNAIETTLTDLVLPVAEMPGKLLALRDAAKRLQAINEELRAATEELETSKEELQSVNEELLTVNQEYKDRAEELGRANSDHLMASTDIGTIFLDRDLHIKRYTPRAQQLFNITSADIGRPLEHFTHKLDYSSLTEDAQDVLRTPQTIEREVHSNDDHCYLARLAPYRTLEDKIDGVVLTFVDITRRTQAEEQLRRQAAELGEQAHILETHRRAGS